MAFIGTHHRQVTRDDVDVAKNQRVQRETRIAHPIFRIRRGRLRGKVKGPAGPKSFGLAFVFNELLRRRCISPTTQGVALLFVSADRFVGKGTAHARFATFRGIAFNTRPAGLLGHGILSTRDPTAGFFVVSDRRPRKKSLSYRTSVATLLRRC